MHCKSTFFQVRTTFEIRFDFSQIFYREIKSFFFSKQMRDRAHVLPNNYRFVRWIRCFEQDSGAGTREGSDGGRERGDLVLTEGIRNPCTYSYQRCDDFSLTIASTERGWPSPTLIRDRSSTWWLGSWRVIGAKKNFFKEEKKFDCVLRNFGAIKNFFRPYLVIKFGRNQIETRVTKSLSDIRITHMKKTRNGYSLKISLNGHCDKKQGFEKRSFPFHYSNR